MTPADTVLAAIEAAEAWLAENLVMRCYRCGGPGTPWKPGDGKAAEGALFVYEAVEKDGCRALILHSDCYEGDMWSDREEWAAWDPVVLWDRLPMLTHPESPDDSEWDAEQYPDLVGDP